MGKRFMSMNQMRRFHTISAHCTSRRQFLHVSAEVIVGHRKDAEIQRGVEKDQDLGGNNDAGPPLGIANLPVHVGVEIHKKDKHSIDDDIWRLACQKCQAHTDAHARGPRRGLRPRAL